MTQFNTTDPSAPVFIVGAPRSGTTMLAAMLGSHSCFAVGPESQFFSKLSPQTLDEAVTDPRWPNSATKALMKLTLADQPVSGLFETNATEIDGFLSERDPSVRSMLEALTEPFAERRGKPIWAEKTPNHLLHLSRIRRHWPKARVVRIMRDPRDAALSTSKLPTFSSSFVANTVLWRSWQDLGEAFLAHDSLSFTLRYEDLVADPASQLQRLCNFLSVKYEPTMMEFAGAASDVSSTNETWKQQVSGALDPSRAFGWRDHLDARQKAFANAVNYEYLVRFGYEYELEPAATKRVFRLSSRFVEAHEQAFLSMVERNERWLPEADWKRADLVCEHPEYRRSRDLRFLAKLVRGRRAFARMARS